MCNCNEHKCCDECLEVKTPHKWAKEIKALADGFPLEGRVNHKDCWEAINAPLCLSCNPITFPDWEWRIKPEPKPDIIKTDCIEAGTYGNYISTFDGKDNVMFVFDGETGELKDVKIIR